MLDLDQSKLFPYLERKMIGTEICSSLKKEGEIEFWVC